MVAALNLVEGVMLGRVVALVDAPADSERLGNHAFTDHMAGHLILDARPDLILVANAGREIWALGPRAGEQTGLAGPGKPAFRFVGGVVRPDVGCVLMNNMPAAMRVLGLEPKTYGLKGRCSAKLSYTPDIH